MKRLTSSALLAALALLSALAQAADTEWFVEAGSETGLDFVHFNGMSGEIFFVEVVGSGVALFDYDNDGDLDVYLVQGHMLGADKTLADATFPPLEGWALIDRLFRNDPALDENGNPTVRFVDVTAASGIQATGYGMGAVAGDYDNDGWTDLFVTNFGPNQLLRNNGDGTFSDQTLVSGTSDVRWSVPAAFLDYDRDGWLDLFVGNYVQFRLSSEQRCATETGAPDYCAPLSYRLDGDQLFGNRGDGTFADRSASSGIDAATPAAALGAITVDVNSDGWVDIYAANDMSPNNLWMNQKDGTFRDDALLAGCAVNAEGQPEASMGVDAGDFDGDGDLDLFMAHFAGETNTLYLNDGNGLFLDQTLKVGLGNPSWEYTAFGTVWFDYDNDGLLDLLTVNGTVRRIEKLVQAGDPLPLHQINQLFRNLGNGTFEEVTDRAGRVFELSEVSRGSAIGDLDNDGDSDVVITNNAGPTRLLLNRIGQRQEWLGLRLLGDRTMGHRNMLGSRTVVHRASDAPLLRLAKTDGSFASSSDPRVLVGLSNDPDFERLDVVWPDGRSTSWIGLPSRIYLVLYQSPSENRI